LDLLEEKKICVYAGLTKRTLKEEAFRFLTARGANQLRLGHWTGVRNRPVLRTLDGNVMRKADVEEAGFTSHFTLSSTVSSNTTALV